MFFREPEDFQPACSRKMKGGPAYVNTAISSFWNAVGGADQRRHVREDLRGTVALIDRLEREQAATLIAANRGLGAGFPPSSASHLFGISDRVAGRVSEGQLYIALF